MPVNNPSTPTPDTVNVHGTVVANPFSFTALVNGLGPVGEVEVNGFPIVNYQPCMSEISPGFLWAGTQRIIGVVYKNISAYPILVDMTYFNSAAANVVGTAYADTNASPTTIVATAVTHNATTTVANLMFFVLPGQYYKVGTSNSSSVTWTWREFLCQNGTFTDGGDVVGSRALSTIYQNNTNNTMFVSAQLSSVNAASLVTSTSDNNPSPAAVVDITTQTSSGANVVTTFFIVPPFHYYKVVAPSGNLAHWHEYSWNIRCTKSSDLAASARLLSGISTTITGGSGTVAVGLPIFYVNSSPFTVRWIQEVSINGNSTATQVAFLAGETLFTNNPSGTTMALSQQTGTINMPHPLRGPVLPGQFYSITDETPGGTITCQHWWEYQLG